MPAFAHCSEIRITSACYWGESFTPTLPPILEYWLLQSRSKIQRRNKHIHFLKGHCLFTHCNCNCVQCIKWESDETAVSDRNWEIKMTPRREQSISDESFIWQFLTYQKSVYDLYYRQRSFKPKLTSCYTHYAVWLWIEVELRAGLTLLRGQNYASFRHCVAQFWTWSASNLPLTCFVCIDLQQTKVLNSYRLPLG